MARRDALMRLFKTLLACRDDQRKKLARDLKNLRDYRAADSASDSVDLAFEADSDELASRLVERDDNELGQIELAIMRWKWQTYGVCESCRKRIPVARLTALPYTAFCIDCERENERTPALRRTQQGQAGPRSPTRNHPCKTSASISPRWKWPCSAKGPEYEVLFKECMKYPPESRTCG